MTKSFRLSWDSGAEAEIEVLCPTAPDPGQPLYQLRYTSPFRSTMRPPLYELHLMEDDLHKFERDLDAAMEDAQAAGVRAGGQGDGAAPAPQAVDRLKMAGEQLCTLILPPYLYADLRTAGLFLEVGTDEALLGYPWELLHDGDDFLCAKHAVGRFVNVASSVNGQRRALVEPGASLGELSVLVISVSHPPERADGTRFDRLDGAEQETEKILEALTGSGVNPVLLKDRDATFDAVWLALRSNPYHIIHFTGHAQFNDNDPLRSGLVLWDQNMTTGHLIGTISHQPPVLCFVNGCETGRTQDGTGKYNIFSIARAFLETGSYLIGSRWKLGDRTAAVFAAAFYSSLLNEGEPIGEAVRQARNACRSTAGDNDDLAWASYVFYGDPRLSFRATDGDAESPKAGAVDTPTEPGPLAELAAEYETLRSSEAPASDLTANLSKLVTRVASLAGERDWGGVITPYLSGTDGQRIVALALLEAAPRPECADLVIDAIASPRSAFEQHHAMVAMRQLVVGLAPAQRSRLRNALSVHGDGQIGDFEAGSDRWLLRATLLDALGETPRDADEASS